MADIPLPSLDLGIATCPARVALAGNPSDGYGGAVCAVPVRSIAATVSIVSSDGVERGGAVGPHAAIPIATRTAAPNLVEAAHAAWARFVDSDVPPLAELDIAVGTTIPQSVGLAGSSAIVIATLQALASFRSVEPNPSLSARSARSAPSARSATSARSAAAVPRPAELATMAWWAENHHLGIACGLQDRVVQAFDRPMLMDFSPELSGELLGYLAGRYTPLTPPATAAWRSARLVVASRPNDAQSSGQVHDDLRRRARGDVAVQAVMEDLAAAARSAADAYLTGDLDALSAAVGSSFAARRERLGVPAGTVALADIANHRGLAANTTGSGGSIVAVAHSADDADALADELRGTAAEVHVIGLDGSPDTA